MEVFDLTPKTFEEQLKKENHTLKRALTDPRLFAGIGNAYSHEILHRARLSPIALTASLTHEEIKKLYEAIRATLELWTAKLRAEAASAFPEKVAAFGAWRNDPSGPYARQIAA